MKYENAGFISYCHLFKWHGLYSCFIILTNFIHSFIKHQHSIHVNHCANTEVLQQHKIIRLHIIIWLLESIMKTITWAFISLSTRLRSSLALLESKHLSSLISSLILICKLIPKTLAMFLRHSACYYKQNIYAMPCGFILTFLNS